MAVSDQIIQVIDDLCERFGIAIDWTSENVVPYINTLCEKLIRYEICSSVFWMIFWVVLCTPCIVGTVVLCKWSFNEDVFDEFRCNVIALCIIISLVVSIITVTVIGVQARDIIEAVTFPEKTIVDYVTSVLNR